MTEFDVKSFIERIDDNHEIRVGRILLSLMRDFKSREPFNCHLASVAFGIKPPQLMAAVNRIMKKIHLDKFASVTIDSEGKVAVAIQQSDLQVPAVQTNIERMLADIHQQAAQRGI